MSLLGSLGGKILYIGTCAFKFNLKRALYIWTRGVNSNACCLNTTAQLFIYKGRPENSGTSSRFCYGAPTVTRITYSWRRRQ